ncbi:MAG: hypothetical protein A2571_03730 [Candidatus Vogelbacteria bacterium RIFOXYD1_FULL_44_32]|uniref:DUF916 domain-containing protein n=1 Tax=Candidatus Vogelbacteria bacterium RIFOXYD1_FULL_44_32 TaxID=1802438 RepID=A0A1G2QDT2_9BACT|nr:MAG: hypothetical protein A2571_03730 [Candidatus Vogelbacteria bacterium RIFOXYD1_FULL_44_32]
MTKYLWLIIIIVGLSAQSAQAQSRPFFGVAPTKLEISVKPGQAETKSVRVVNHLGAPAQFSLALESFEPENNGRGVIISNKNLYYVEKYISTPYQQFTLAEGEAVDIPVTVTAPAGGGPSSIFGVLAIEGQVIGEAKAAARLSSRLGVLIFIKTAGLQKEQGQLTAFGLVGGPINFNTGRDRSTYISYKNTGNVHINPYGYIEAKYLGVWKTQKIAVNPWFVLPDSTRTNEIVYLKPLAYGPYLFTLKQNRGYGDIIDKQSFFGILLPSRLVTFLSGLGLVLFFILIRKMLKRPE